MHRVRSDLDDVHTPTYAARLLADDVPTHRFPATGSSPRVAAALVRDELNLDGNPVLNLASFVTTWMEPHANLLAADSLAKNLIDQDEYPQSQAIHERVVTMVARLFHAPGGGQATGTAPPRRSCWRCSPTSGRGSGVASRPACRPTVRTW
jgi:glutamate decarboxylase